MNDKMNLFLAFVAGLGLGVVFFGGLWLTVKKGIQSSNTALWFFFSFLIRIAVTLFGFYLIADGSLQKLLLCFSGFILMRMVFTKKVKSPIGAGDES